MPAVEETQSATDNTDAEDEPGPTEEAEVQQTPHTDETIADSIPPEAEESAAPAENSEPDNPEEEAAVPEPTDAESTSDSPEEVRHAPFAVPAPERKEAVITVSVGSDRTGNTTVADLEGLRLRLYDGGSSGPTDPVDEDWATCVSDSDSDCSFTIPETQRGFLGLGRGDNYHRRFWVVAESAPSGWHVNDTLVTGTASPRDYAFRTGRQLRGGQTYRSGQDFMTGSNAHLHNQGNQQDSGGLWQASRANPQLPERCEAGLNVALVLDLSASVSNAGALGNLQDASKGVADALAGSQSSMALYTFGTTAPLNTSPSGRNAPLVPLDQGDNLKRVKERIDAYQPQDSGHVRKPDVMFALVQRLVLIW